MSAGRAACSGINIDRNGVPRPGVALRQIETGSRQHEQKQYRNA
ncbi:hypothetical protein EKH55_3050 [Sinorhizobium alkalisoli]|nr:hypothetical protein EKH55_3050 [Sinorhizobium alkalisoli]